ALRPLRGPKLPGANESQGRALQSRFDHGVTLIAADGPQELRDLARLGDGCPVGDLDGRQGTAQIARRIPLGSPRRDRIAHDLADSLPGTVSGLVLAAPLEPAEHVKELPRREPGTRSRSDIRDQQVL